MGREEQIEGMNKEQQIKQMMLDVPQNIVAYDGNPVGQHLYGEQRQQIAEALYNAGYHKTFTSDFASDTQKAYKEGYIKGIEEIEAENERLKADNEALQPKKKYENIDDIVRGFIVKDGKIMYVTNILNGCRQEFKDIHRICDELNNNMKEIDSLMECNNYLRFQLEECKKLTVKEFAEELKKKVHNYYPSIDSYCTSRHVILVEEIDELLKDYEK